MWYEPADYYDYDGADGDMDVTTSIVLAGCDASDPRQQFGLEVRRQHRPDPGGGSCISQAALQAHTPGSCAGEAAGGSQHHNACISGIGAHFLAAVPVQVANEEVRLPPLAPPPPPPSTGPVIVPPMESMPPAPPLPTDPVEVAPAVVLPPEPPQVGGAAAMLALCLHSSAVQA